MIIQVDPSLLQSGSQQIQGISGNISSLIKDLVSIVQSAPSYEGQFGPKVVEIGNEADARGEKLSGVLINLGERLGLKGIEFSNVDTAAISGFNGVTRGIIGWLEPSLSQHEYLGLLDFLKRYLSLGHLLHGNRSDFSKVAVTAMILGTGRWRNGWTFFGMVHPSWWPSRLPWSSEPPENITSPVVEIKSTASRTSFGDLLNEPSPAKNAQTNSTSTETSKSASSPAQTTVTPALDSTTNSYDVYYDVPAESQGILNANRACSPTSVSMVLNYYHVQNSANAGVTTEQLLAPLNAGGKNIGLESMNNEIKDLGYQNISTKVGSSLADLQSTLKDGPVIVTTGVNLVGTSTVPRAITGPGTNYIHAMVVKGYNKDNIVVNDPWTGQELTFSTETFMQMWNFGSSGMYVIRP